MEGIGMKRANKYVVGSLFFAGVLSLVATHDALAAPPAEAPTLLATCGTRGSPPSPLQVIMRGMDKKNAASVRAGLASISEPPPGFSNWSKFINSGLAASREGDFDPAAVEAACKACHTENRMRFQHEEVRCVYKK